MKNAKNGILLDDSYVETHHVVPIAQEPLIVKISGRYNRRSCEPIQSDIFLQEEVFCYQNKQQNWC